MDHANGTETDGAPDLSGDDVPAACPCGVASPAPWRKRDALDSPASVVAGLILIAFGVAAVAASRVPAVGWGLLGLEVGLTMLGAIILFRRGHRSGCLIGRSLWTGVAWFGLPVRVVAAVPF